MNDDGSRLVRSLSIMTLIQWLGASEMIPLLPLYIHRRSGSDATVGLVVASFFLAGVVFQYPAGRLVDRIGYRPVLVGGLVCFGAGSIGFGLPLDPVAYAVLRFVQGAGTGATQVASLAIAARAIAPDRRGRAVGSIYAGQLAGMAIGPLIGSAVGSFSVSAVFALGGVTSLFAWIPMRTSSRAIERTEVAGAQSYDESLDGPGDVVPLRIARRMLVGSVVTAVAFGLTVGVYETCWTLLLTANGAASWQVGISWTLFALPFILMAHPGGWLADHLDRRHLVIGTLAVSLGCCAGYPFLHRLPLLIGLGAVEAMAIAVAIPSVQSLLAQSAPRNRLGRAQGLFSTGQTAATALAAGVSGPLLSAAVWLPFVSCAVIGAFLVLALPLLWAPVVGRVSGSTARREELGPAI